AIARIIIGVAARAGVEHVATAEAAVARQRPHALLEGHEVAVGGAAAAAAVLRAPSVGIVGQGLGRRGRRHGNGGKQSSKTDAHGGLLGDGGSARGVEGLDRSGLCRCAAASGSSMKALSDHCISLVLSGFTGSLPPIVDAACAVDLKTA